MQHQADTGNQTEGFERELKQVNASQERNARVQELEGSLTVLEAQHASMNEAAHIQHAEVGHGSQWDLHQNT